MNKQIESYLDYYLNLPKGPGFAVLLNGEWGSGKTWFINDYIDQKKDADVKFLKISLYGISSLADIDAQIFQQLHPILSSKTMMLTGKFLKGAVKLGLKVDLDGDDKSDMTVNLQTIEDNFSKEAIDKYIVVFDDLERSVMPQSSTMGYINALVEQQGMKSIVLSDETKIVDPKYASIKEKTIGMTLQVSHDLDSVYDVFIQKITDDKTLTVLTVNKLTVLDVFKTAGYRNLRHLSQTFFGFEFLARTLEARYFEIPALMQELLRQYCIFSIEGKKNNDFVKELTNISEILVSAGIASYLHENGRDNLEEEKSPLLPILQKYSLGHTSILLDGLWSDILGKGLIDNEAIKASLENSQFLVNESSPEWKRLWHYRNLEDAEFTSVLDEVLTKLSNRQYDAVGEIFHVVAMLLSFSKASLYSKDRVALLDECKKYIEDKFDDDSLLENEIEYFVNRHDYGWESLGFFDKDNQEFREFREHFDKCAEQRSEKKLLETAHKLVDYVNSGKVEEVRKIFFDHEKQTRLYDYTRQPFFKFVDVDAFVEALVVTSNKNKWELAHILKGRFNDAPAAVIEEEKEFLEAWDKALQDQAQRLKGKVSGDILDDMRDYIIKDLLRT